MATLMIFILMLAAFAVLFENAPRQAKEIFLVILISSMALATCSSENANAEEVIRGKASWYSKEACKHNPGKDCPTASRRSLYDLERKGVLFAASYDFGIGESVCVYSEESGKEITVRILDRGPARRLKRVIDLGVSAFRKINDTKKGITSVIITKGEC